MPPSPCLMERANAWGNCMAKWDCLPGKAQRGYSDYNWPKLDCHCCEATKIDLPLKMMLLDVLILIPLLLQITDAKQFKNVRGETLEPCSGNGMAQTGFDRTGSCTEVVDDLGSHHICLDLSKTIEDGVNFCTETGQPNWCASEMECHGDISELCPVKQWCVCQWAFADYLESVPQGCDGMIDMIVCDSTNIEAYKAYELDIQYAEAAACLKRRCSIP